MSEMPPNEGKPETPKSGREIVLRLVRRKLKKFLTFSATFTAGFVAGIAVTNYLDKLDLFSRVPSFYRDIASQVKLENAWVVRDGLATLPATVFARVNNQTDIDLRMLWLGASAETTSGHAFSSPAEDTWCVLTKGTTVVRRSFTFPEGAPPGYYRFIVRIWYGNIGDPAHSKEVDTWVTAQDYPHRL